MHEGSTSSREVVGGYRRTREVGSGSRFQTAWLADEPARFCQTGRIPFFQGLSSLLGEVRFRWKNYRHPQRRKIMSLVLGKFIRRFLVHVLPDGFRRIGHFGFLAQRAPQCQPRRDPPLSQGP
jgi:hypothetical protein